MAEVKINVPFIKVPKHIGQIETYRILSVDILADKVVVEVEKEIAGENWTARRQWTWSYTQSSFYNDGYQYL